MSQQSKLFVAAIAVYALIASAPSWARAHDHDEPVELAVKELQLARGVESRRPVKPGTEFAADGEQIYAYLCLANAGEATRVRLVWRRGAEVYHRITLKVGHSKSWRTWGYIRALRHLAGEWQVRVETLEGEELMSKRFVIRR